MKSFGKWNPVIVMIAIDLAFAISNILLKKIVSHGVDHLVFITYRQAISAAFLSPLAFFLERGSRPKLTLTVLCHLFVSAIIGASVTQYLFLVGIENTSATFSCAFLNIVPVLTFLMALPFGLERVNIKSSSGRAKIMGSTVCVGGAILLTLYKGVPLFHFSDHPRHIELNPSLGRERWAFGSVALLAGTLCWSSWFLLQTSIAKRYPCQYSSTAIMAFFSALQSALFSLSIDRKLSVWVFLGKSDFFIILYAGMIGSGLCFVGMSWCVKKRGPVFTAFNPLVQIMAAILTFHSCMNSFMSEGNANGFQYFLIVIIIILLNFHASNSLIGSVTVIAGLYIMLWGKDKEMQNQEKLVPETEEELKERDTEFPVIKVSVESEHP